MKKGPYFMEIDRLKGSKPNILLIVSDDHGYGDMSFLNVNDDLQTPNLDRLRASGIFFENAYVTAPICSPSRAGLIVGNHQQRWGARWFGNSHFAPKDYMTIPQILHKANYRTGYFGKVHYGPDEEGSRACPEKHGFDESFYGLAAYSYGRLHYLEHAVDAFEKYGEKSNYVGMNAMYENGRKVDCKNFLTEEFTNRAIDFIDKTQQQPFFCMLAYNAVHNFTWQLPKEELEKRGLPAIEDFDPTTADYIDWYDGVITPNLPNGRAYYLAQLELMDEHIGRLLDYLKAKKLRENTLVIYVTDNGGSPCNYGSNAPLHGSKYSLYEGGIRVPYILSWPGVLKENQQMQEMVSTLDFMPTMAYLAGVDPREYKTDGLNLFETIKDKKGHQSLYFDTGFQWSLRQGDWKLRCVTQEEGASARESLLKVEHTDIGQPGKSLVHLSASLDESPNANLIEKEEDLAKKMEADFLHWQEKITNNKY